MSILKHLKLEQVEQEQIWVCYISNPPANAITVSALNEIEQVMNKFTHDSKAHVLIISGEGERAFCAGADINEIVKIDSPARGKELAQRGQEICNLLENSEKPIIAAINGLCLGGGNEIALACHMRISSERAKFGQPEINLGIIPGWGGTQRLSRLIGISKARKLILTGDTISAKDAFAFGLVDELVEQGKAVERAIDLARKINVNSQPIVRLAEMAMKQGDRLKMEDGLKREIECFENACRLGDMNEALRAFKEKRQPNFKNK